MSTPLKHGMTITLEGMDGCGKTTQARELVKNLQALNYEVVHVKEPGGSVDADKIRKLLLEDISDDVDPGVEVMLFMAAKIDLYQRVVKPALERGAIVVSERGWHSMFAYQGSRFSARGELALYDLRVMSPFIGGPSTREAPSLQILLRQSLQKTRERLAQRAEKLDHFESKPDSFYDGVHQRFDQNFQSSFGKTVGISFMDSVEIVDVETGSVEEIAAQVLHTVTQYMETVYNAKPVLLCTNMHLDSQHKG